MMDERRGQDEVSELSGLAREAAAPAVLEERVVQTLRREGLLVAPVRRWRQSLVWAGAAAAAAVIFFAGVLTGAARRPAAPPDFQPTYALLLRSGPGYQETESEAQEQLRVEEYRAWARGTYQSGVGIRGEKLNDDSRLLREETVESPARGPQETERLGGFFLINAHSLDEALRVARSCPHLRYGGTIEVRPIDPT